MSLIDFFQLKEHPFSITVDLRYFYSGQQHAEALVRLKYAVENMKGLAVLVGDIGTGKTTLATRLLEELDTAEYEAAMLVVMHGGITSEWMLRKIALQMEVANPAETKIALLTQLSRRLEEIMESGRKAVVIIDEAQMLDSQDLMEDFRGLLNIEINGLKAVTFVLFGMPELDNVLGLDKSLQQRVAVRYHLTALNAAGTADYINYRLQIAGSQNNMFERGAIPVICEYSHGIPRLINTVCDNALLEAFLRKQERIGAELIREVAKDLKLST
ncbi:MAG TPA: AAA family ATPase [Nitrospirales bacterium]|nr:AAA family ATPase [Nitrospirales bacterium]